MLNSTFHGPFTVIQTFLQPKFSTGLLPFTYIMHISKINIWYLWSGKKIAQIMPCKWSMEIRRPIISTSDIHFTSSSQLWRIRSSQQRCSIKGVRPVTSLKKRLWHRCFPANFAKFLRTPFLQNTSGRLLLKNHSAHFWVM